jgi:flagella basal body P-ring formation protein FlgA
MRRLSTLFVALLMSLPVAAPAFAGEPVELRVGAVGHGGTVTLGDLFEGASGPAATVVVARAPVGTETVLDAGEVQLAAHAAGLDWANTQGRLRIVVDIASASAPQGAGRRDSARRLRRAQTLVYARNISAGEILQAEDLEWSDEAVAGPDAPSGPERVIGLAAREPLRVGAPVADHDLAAPKVIRRDQMIAVDYAEGGISLSLTAKALGDAAVGDTVQVQNVSSKKVIEAVATAPGHAAVGAAADDARNQAMGAGFRTAALP